MLPVASKTQQPTLILDSINEKTVFNINFNFVNIDKNIQWGLLTWPNKDDQKWPCKMTENAKDCKHYFFRHWIWPKMTTVNGATSISMTENDFLAL